MLLCDCFCFGFEKNGAKKVKPMSFKNLHFTKETNQDQSATKRFFIIIIIIIILSLENVHMYGVLISLNQISDPYTAINYKPLTIIT